MANIIDRMTRRLRQKSPEIGDLAPVDPDQPAPPAEPGKAEPGVDARRVAEQKSEEAGRRWRAEAEARGEVAKETGGPKGLEPTRYGDWEKAGRCIDF
jgi:hypothetical protein